MNNETKPSIYDIENFTTKFEIQCYFELTCRETNNIWNYLIVPALKRAEDNGTEIHCNLFIPHGISGYIRIDDIDGVRRFKCYSPSKEVRPGTSFLLCDLFGLIPLVKFIIKILPSKFIKRLKHA